MKRILLIVLALGMAGLAGEPRDGKVETATLRDAAGRLVSTKTIVNYPNGKSVTVRDAGGKIVGTWFLAKPELRK